jgi:hypothetical protein
MPKDSNPSQLKTTPDLIEVIDLGLDGDVRGTDATRRPPASALVVVDQPTGVGDLVQLRNQIAVIEVRTTVKHDERMTRTDLAHVQLGAVDGQVPFVDHAASSAVFAMALRADDAEATSAAG